MADDAAPDPRPSAAPKRPALFQTPNLRLPQFRQSTPAPDQGQGPDPLLSRAAVRNLDDLYTAAAAIGDAQREQSAQLTALLEAVQAGIDLLNQAARPGVSITFPLKASQAFVVDTQGYKHSYLLVATAAQTAIFDIPGVGAISRALNQDWNRLDYPDGTRITIAADPAAGTAINALLRLQDEPIDV